MSAFINGIEVLTPSDLKKISQILPQVTATDSLLLVVEQTDGTGANTSVGSIRATLIPVTQKGLANGVATLGPDGKIPASQLPALAVVDVYPVGSQAAMLACAAEQGDIAVRTDSNQVFILAASPASTLANWVELSALKALVDAAIADLAGAGRTTETVKKNADDIAGHEVRIQELEGRKFGLYGFKKHKLTGACTPIYDSVALGPVPVIRGSRPAEFSNPYKSIRIFNWRSCLMDTKQRILAYYGQAGYDVPTHDSQSYEVEIPAAYINQWEDEYYTYRVMSEVPQLPGMFIPGAFRDNLGREMPFAYVDKYRRGVLNGYSVSRPDVLPEVSITLNAAELKAEAVDTDTLWTGCPEEFDWYITFVAEIMACNTDSQAAYGQGMSSLPYSASHTVVSVTTDANTIVVSNATANAFKVSMNVKLGSALGSGQTFEDRFIQSITDNGDGNSTIVVDGDPFTTVVGYILHAHRQVTTSYEAEQIGEDCGFILHNGRSETQVENWINGIAGHGGNVYEFSFGLLRYDNYVYLCHDRYQFKHNDDPRNNSAFKNVGFFEQTDGGTYGWIKNMSMVGEAPYVTEWVSELGAGSTTHYADVAYYLTPTYRGTRIVLRRFHWNIGSICGRRSLHGYSVLSASSWSIGWRASPSKLPKQVS